MRCSESSRSRPRLDETGTDAALDRLDERRVLTAHLVVERHQLGRVGVETGSVSIRRL